MSMKKSGLLIAAAAASLILAGCATQGATDNGSTSQPVPEVASNSCKGMSSCKGMNKCKGMKAKRAKKAAKTAAE
ncbi:MAG: hypothetical protein ACNA7Y_01100 [Gammaproteobacteria bacterium]